MVDPREYTDIYELGKAIYLKDRYDPEM